MKLKNPDFGNPQTSTEQAAHDWLVEYLGQEGPSVMKSLSALIQRQTAHPRTVPMSDADISNMISKLRECNWFDAANFIEALCLPQPSLEASAREIIERCAKFVEQNQETVSETANGSSRHLTPRKVGNQMGLAYVDGLRALSA